MADLSLAYGSPHRFQQSGPSSPFGGDFGAPIGEGTRLHDSKTNDVVKHQVSDAEYEKKMRERESILPQSSQPSIKSTPLGLLKREQEPRQQLQPQLQPQLHQPQLPQPQHQHPPQLHQPQPFYQNDQQYQQYQHARPPSFQPPNMNNLVKTLDKTLDKTCKRVSVDSIKLIVLTLVILIALGFHSAIERMLGNFITSVDWSPDREMFMRIVYPAVTVLALWFITRQS